MWKWNFHLRESQTQTQIAKRKFTLLFVKSKIDRLIKWLRFAFHLIRIRNQVSSRSRSHSHSRVEWNEFLFCFWQSYVNCIFINDLNHDCLLCILSLWKLKIRSRNGNKNQRQYPAQAYFDLNRTFFFRFSFCFRQIRSEWTQNKRHNYLLNLKSIRQL